MFSTDIGAITRDAAVSESGSDSETDEELHPLVLKPPRYGTPADVTLDAGFWGCSSQVSV